jgi:hypothetical protein
VHVGAAVVADEQPFELVQPGMPIADSSRCLATLPPSGSMRSGVLYELPTSARRTSAPAYGWLPTPTHTANQFCDSMMKHVSCRNLKRLFPAGELCLIYEWLMGFPIGWSDASASETLSSRRLPSGSGGRS